MARWLIALMLGALSVFIIVANPLEGRRAVRQGRSYSWLPFIGGLAGLLAILVLPIGSWRDRLWFAWIPIALDLTYAMFLYVAVWYWLLGHEPVEVPVDRQGAHGPSQGGPPILSLLEFLRTARLGNIGIGASGEEVLAAFGHPTDVSEPSGSNAAKARAMGSVKWAAHEGILKYGTMEFSFDHGILRLIHCDAPAEAWAGGGDLRCDFGPLQPGAPLDAISAMCREWGLEVREVVEPDFGRVLLRLRSGVVLGFDPTDPGTDGQPTLAAMSVSLH